MVNSSFAYSPGIPIWYSEYLVYWKEIGYCLTRENQLQFDEAAVSGGVWTPTLRYHNGRFYMVTTNQVTSTYGRVTRQVNGRIPSMWTRKVLIPPYFFDEDKVYFTSAGSLQGMGIYQCEIDIETGQKLSDSRLIWTGSGGKFPEGLHLYEVNGYYHLICAEGGTEYGHMETKARSTSPYGPYESSPRNPILTHRSSDYPIQATGYADLVEV